MSDRHSTGNGTHVPAAAYIRMSSDKQEASPEQQRAEVAKLAERGDYHLVVEYFDAGISGDATEKRKQFQQMIADAERGKFKAILCWDQDRFGRFDSIEAGRWIYPLRQAGVKLVTVAQGTIDWTDFAGRLIYNVTQEAKHAYLRDLSRNVLRGRTRAAKLGRWLSRPPLGYVLDKRTKQIHLGDHREVAIVKRIFRDYQAGASLRSIAMQLNADNLVPSGRSLWNPKTVHDILSNHAYCGRYRWHASRRGKYHSIGENGDITPNFTRGRCDESEWFIIENHHEAIMDAESFDAVQRTLSERKRQTTPIRGGGDYLFTGLLKCGKCGSTMHGAGGTSDAHRYQCARHRDAGTCDGVNVRQDELLKHILRAIEGRFGEPETMSRLRERLQAKLVDTTRAIDATELKTKLATAEADLAKARRNMALADDDDMRREYEAVLRELRQERDRLAASIQNAEKPSGRTQDELGQRVEKAVAALQRLSQTFPKAQVETRRELLRKAIDRVDVWAVRDRWHGAKPFRLQRGVIHLRPEMWLPSGQNLLPTTD